MATIADINAETRALCDADTTSYQAADLLRRINAAYEQVIAWILQADGNWQWDDTNNSTNPIGIGTLVEGQTSYAFSDEFLEIEEIDVLDSSGVYVRIKAFDPSELGDMSAEEYFGITTSNTPKGMPEYYDKQGNNIKFYPAPTSTACTLTNGLKVHFKRTAALFTSAEVSTGTKNPGFASPFHYILSYMAAIPYCMSYKKDRVTLYERKIGDTLPPTGMKKDILAFYGHRELDKRKIMSMRKTPHI